MVVKQPQSTRVKEPTLLCNQVDPSTRMSGLRVYQALANFFGQTSWHCSRRPSQWPTGKLNH